MAAKIIFCHNLNKDIIFLNMKENFFDTGLDKLEKEFPEEKSSQEIIATGIENAPDLGNLKEEMRAEVKVENLDVLSGAKAWLDRIDSSQLQSALKKFVLSRIRAREIRIEKYSAKDGAGEERLLLVGQNEFDQEDTYILATRSPDSNFKY